jgi:hypothetical protein
MTPILRTCWFGVLWTYAKYHIDESSLIFGRTIPILLAKDSKI